MNPTSLSSQSQRIVSPLQGTPYSMNASPMRSQRIQQQLPPQHNYVKPNQQNQYTVQVTPPRSSQAQHMATPSTAQTQISNNSNALAQSHASVPSRFNQALDQVCLLGHEMDQMRKNFEEVQIELQAWKDKCAFIKAIAQTPPPGINYSPARTNKLHNEVHNSFENYQAEINKLNSILSAVNGDLASSVDRIRQLEKRVGEMNKLELEMLQTKKQALELDNKNRFQALELNDLKSRMDSRNNLTEDMAKMVQTIPHLRESVQVLEMENKKLIQIISQKDDQIDKQDQKHIQLTKMYQDNLEKTNQISQQLREALGENEEINVEVERTHNISESVNNMNIQNSIYSNNQPNSVNKGKGFLNPDGSLRESVSSSKRPSMSGTQNRNLRNSQRLHDVQNTILEQQGSLEALQKQLQEYENRVSNGDSERTIMAKQIDDYLNEIDNLRALNQRERQNHDDDLRRARQEFQDQITSQVVPLQQENDLMHSDIQQMQRDLQNLKHSAQCLENDKAALLDQLALERQQALSAQQQIINEFQQKCDALSDALVMKDRDLDSEIIKNKELFEDNKLMAEEMRILKQRSAELEIWKNKYRDLKKEMKNLRLQFDEYKKNFIREIQSRFAISCDQFDQCLQYIDDQFDSTRGSQANDHYPLHDTNQRSQYISSQAPPGQTLPTSEKNSRQSSPSQDRLRQMKSTPSRSSVVSSSQIVPRTNPETRMSSQPMNNIPMQLNGNNQGQQTTVPQQLIHPSQPTSANASQYQMHHSQHYPERGSQMNGYASGNSTRQSMINNTQEQGRYQKELLQTNNELDNKIEELVVLKAKYEDALNRVHSNINSATPKKVMY